MDTPTLKQSVNQQREKLTLLLGKALLKLAKCCPPIMQLRIELEALLEAELPNIGYCKHLYVLDAQGVQVTANITRTGQDLSHFARNRMTRPYMQEIIGHTDFKLSEAYISRNKKRPSLTAIQVIRDESGERIGFLGADYDLRELPGSLGVYQEPNSWRQIKGDPAIRGGLFLQHRTESEMDRQLDMVLPLLQELILEHGVFHGKLHFSSNRGTIWLVDNPYSYRILNIEELCDPDICLAYPHMPYTQRAIVPAQQIMPVFNLFRTLRFADDNIYLRAGSLNVCNGMVALNFSCDGSHYLPYDEFLNNGVKFWFGALGV
ncbi:PDC sensor domain-containing protein [Candidatus Venteria ishoeyi]|uniref:PDC sensor domain-containing protein n=1 Tax=Candidatus Venteria ishoeyi TaxID=1899563 RepID=UPI0025A66631|nr:PDC sensor domain-containing protein [Candidatus Venteria ishoeyi]MDM8547479.1 PDC sensor domain-containing protein [Candidatus Venteria ishoeyi]